MMLKRSRRTVIKTLLGTGFLMAKPSLGQSVASATLNHVSRDYAQPRRNAVLTLPRDHGPHRDFKTEWWYFTGWFTDQFGESWGIQITFFRSAPDVNLNNPSHFNPSQLIIAHVALGSAKRGSLLHDQASARAYPGLVEITGLDSDAQGDCLRLSMPGWSLRSTQGEQWVCRISTPKLKLNLTANSTQPPWLQGDKGYSQKGPRPEQSSHYITLPHLQTQGEFTVDGKKHRVQGQFWMDHEWSSTVLSADAQGWDWVGLHGLDGSSLMAFQIRPQKSGQPPIWTHACQRDAKGRISTVQKCEFIPLKNWRSPQTGTVYPVSQKLKLDQTEYLLLPLMDNQELDARASTGTLYWEGAVKVVHASSQQPWGEGFLELTGYDKPIKL